LCQNGFLKLSRRKSFGLLAGLAAPAAVAQAPQTQPSSPPDALLESARNELKSAAQRVATVKLPRDVAPAFRFRA
jgi:hypothetical protein